MIYKVILLHLDGKIQEVSQIPVVLPYYRLPVIRSDLTPDFAENTYLDKLDASYSYKTFKLHSWYLNVLVYAEAI